MPKMSMASLLAKIQQTEGNITVADGVLTFENGESVTLADVESFADPLFVGTFAGPDEQKIEVTLKNGHRVVGYVDECCSKGVVTLLSHPSKNWVRFEVDQVVSVAWPSGM